MVATVQTSDKFNATRVRYAFKTCSAPGLLLQMAFFRCYKTMKGHFMVLERINRTAWGTKLLLTAV